MELSTVRYAAWIGIDWGSEKHALCLQVAGSTQFEHFTLEQDANNLHSWFMKLEQRFPGGQVAVAIEQSKGAVVNFLMGLPLVHIFRIHPKSLQNYRLALYPSGAKDDPVDAQLLVQFGQIHQDKIRPWIPDTVDARLLQRLVEFRRKTVQQRVGLTNQLTQVLKEYFPQALDWAGALDHRMALDFLGQWPTLQKLKKSKGEGIRRFYQEHHCRSKEQIDRRLEEIASAQPLTSDPAILESSQLMVRTLLPQLGVVLKAIEELEARIQEVYQRQPDAEIFSSFPGAGAALAPRLQSMMGSDRQRFSSAQDVAEYSGIAPVLERSGKSQWVHRRWACSHFVKQSVHEFAGQSIRFCGWARAYYDSKRAAGMRHHSAIRALAYKWLRILFCCWRDRVPYNEEVYLASLKAKHPDWLKFLSPDVKTLKNA